MNADVIFVDFMSRPLCHAWFTRLTSVFSERGAKSGKTSYRFLICTPAPHIFLFELGLTLYTRCDLALFSKFISMFYQTLSTSQSHITESSSYSLSRRHSSGRAHLDRLSAYVSGDDQAFHAVPRDQCTQPTNLEPKKRIK